MVFNKKFERHFAKKNRILIIIYITIGVFSGREFKKREDSVTVQPCVSHKNY